MNRAQLGLVWLACIGPTLATAQQPVRYDAAGSAAAARKAQDRKAYSIFNPTPWSEARELSTDRPDKTESPYTVPAGRVQFEIDVVNYTRDVSGTGSGRTRFESLAIAPINMKVGLVRNVDLQLVLETYVRNRSRVLASQLTSTNSQFGEVTGRLKVNVWGNDGGKTAFGIMPFVSFVPADGGGRYANGGVILPLAVDLGGGFGLGTMAEIDFERGDVTGKRHTVFIHSVTVGHDLSEKVGAYAELFSGISTETGARWVGGFNFGFTRALGANMQLDFGANIGLSRAADDFNPFLGLSFRF